MFSSVERFIAFRYLRARRREGWISLTAFFSLFGIALGVATLIVVLSVMRGVREEMTTSMVGLEGHVTVEGGPQGIGEIDLLSRGIMLTPGVTAVVPVVQGQVMASFHGRAAGAMVSGLRAVDLAHKPLITQRLTAGSTEGGLLIGSRMAERLGVGVGDLLTLISPEGRATPVGTIPRIQAYPVAGIFTIGMFAYDNGLVVMPFDNAQIYFQRPHKASALEVMIAQASDAPTIAASLRDAMPNFTVHDWMETNGHLLQAVQVQRNVMLLVLALIIVVAAFNIVSSLVMMVQEKQRGIAILRTMGATRSAVQRIFILVGASVGVAGTVLGVALGLLISFNTEGIQAWIESLSGQKILANELYFLSHLPAKVDAGEVALVVALALAVAFMAAAYPASRAAALEPADVLR